MPENKSFLQQISQDIEQLSTGAKGAVLGFILGLLLIVFGLWKTIFVLLMTLIGYIVGLRVFTRYGSVRDFLDKIFPPGFFR